MIEKSKSGVSIIGGADGPTSIFIAGKIQKKSLKVKIRNAIYKHKHKRAEKKIVAGAHTLNELVQYALNKYDLVEINVAERKCIELYFIQILSDRFFIRNIRLWNILHFT